MSVYRVLGPHRYREHEVGETFEAYLEPDVESRALRHGTLELLERSEPGLQPGSFTFPRGWQAPQRQTQEV